MIGVNIQNDSIKQIHTQKSSYESDLVVNTSDYPFFETQILPKEHRSYDANYWEKSTIAPSGFIAYLGFNKKIQSLSHHNLFLDNDWMKHFESIFNTPSWPDSPSYYVSCPSKTDPTLAPKDCENVFVLVPVAPGLSDTDEIREHYFEKIIKHSHPF